VPFCPGCNAVCIGHALFGLYPFPIELACTQELLPVIAQLSSQLIQVTQHGQGADLAIANEFGLDRDRIIGVLPVGLAHGISRPAPGKTCEALCADAGFLCSRYHLNTLRWT
jgi:alanine racemase